LVNTACGVKEAMHGLFKKVVPYTNKKNIDIDLLRHYNTLQALRFWLDGGRDERLINSRNFYQNSKHFLPKRLLSGWYITKPDDSINEFELEDNEPNGNSLIFFLSIQLILLIDIL
jgi:hypothetical protein